MTHAARQTAFETFKLRDREHNEVYRLTSGFREEHVIQNFAEIYRQVREELSERREGDKRRQLQFTDLMNERGVIVTNLETLYDGFATHGWSDQFEE